MVRWEASHHLGDGRHRSHPRGIRHTAYGVLRGALRPHWGRPLQPAAMRVLATAALVAVEPKQTSAGLLVAVGLLAHAVRDTYHHRTN